MEITREKLILFVVLSVIGIILSKVQFSKIENSTSFFTYYDFFAPAISGIIGLPLSIISLILVKVILLLGSNVQISVFDIVRIITPIAAVAYFYKKGNRNYIIPVVAIIGFILHPVGRMAIPYTFLWLIPIAANLLWKNFSFARALGATFSQHALGGVLFIYLIPTTPEFWINLIPIVIQERILMAIGILFLYTLIKELIQYFKKQREFKINYEFYNIKES